MHPAVTSAQPGRCTQCGMTLERVHPGEESAAYRLEVNSGQDPLVPNRPFPLALTVRTQAGDRVVKQFTVVHEKRFHLFVISRDLKYYQHLHPTQDANGVWQERLTLPSSGEYRIYADILPTGGTAQLLTGALKVGSGAESDSGGSPAVSLQPDSVLERNVGDVRVQLTLPREGLFAGSHQALRFRFTHAKTGAPLRDLQPYLGAWGHTIMVSEDMEHFVHAHPKEPLAGKAGGPQLTFSAEPPAAGRYRVWTQIMRGGSLETVVFTLAVSPSH